MVKAVSHSEAVLHHDHRWSWPDGPKSPQSQEDVASVALQVLNWDVLRPVITTSCRATLEQLSNVAPQMLPDCGPMTRPLTT